MECVNIVYGQHCVPNWSWYVPVYRREGYTLWSVWGGSGEMQLGDKHYKIGAGDFFFIDYSKTVNAIQFKNSDMLNVRFIDIYTDKNIKIGDFIEHKKIFNSLLLKEIFDRIRTSFYDKNYNNIRIWADALLLEYSGNTEKIDTENENRIMNVCSQFQQSPHLQYSIFDIAKSYGYSIDHFIRLFKQIYKTTPYAYLQNLRLDTAKTLLKSSNLSINEIAALSGFNDIYNFSKFFSSKTGISPKKYRGL